jgi:hypothetical protein
MITVSNAWREINKELLLPETFVEISCSITEQGVQESAVAEATSEAVFSDISSITGTSAEQTTKKYATLEPNLWVLDGSRSILPDNGPYLNVGYVSDTIYGGSVTLNLPEVHTRGIPGMTIIWSSEYNEYATDFTITAKNGDVVVAETTVHNNTSNKSIVYFEISNYDSVTVTINEWCLPNHRSRIDTIHLGLDMTFTKNDILNYTHEQSGCLVSGELPKNSIDFSLDNTDNRWNPSNPTGLEQYLSERQRLTVRYGLDVNGTTEWIKAGTFYLSEWRAPSNGLEASFVARDMLEFMINAPYTGIRSGTLYEIATAAVEQADLPTGSIVNIDPVLKKYTGVLGDQEYTIAEILQMCANAACCVFYQDRNGVLQIKPFDLILSEYSIDSEFSYSWPESELAKKLKNVSVSWGENNEYVLPVGDTGETQTVSNPLVSNEAHALSLAQWIAFVLENRETISGEYRADPRLDLFDYISVGGKFGDALPVVISNIKYSYSGAFRGSYSGRVIKMQTLADRNGNIITDINGNEISVFARKEW